MIKDLYERIVSKKAKIAVVGLGYVGLPLAAAFSKHAEVIGYDSDERKIELCRSGRDPTGELGDRALSQCAVEFSSDERKLAEARFCVIAVPTPINSDKTPDLSLIKAASRTVGRNLARGTLVMYESTVYPGITEDVCVAILEECSGLRCKADFWVGYSPERINPGDKIHRLENIRKIVSGIDGETLFQAARIYELVVKAGVHRAPCIRVAEAAKVVENSQRDINIAFMNELAMVFDKMGIDTLEVIEAMNTKWNALGFRPGLVGGHCIGVDPYYFVYEAERLGYHSQIVLAGRKVNDSMSAYVGEKIIRLLIQADKCVRRSRVAILGVTFKEDCPDTRNSRVADIIEYLRGYGVTPLLCDPVAAASGQRSMCGIELTALHDVKDADCVAAAVAHSEFKALPLSKVADMFSPSDESRVLIDIKGIFDKSEAVAMGFRYWRL